MTFEFQDFAATIRANQTITARDTLALRQWTWADGKINSKEADALFDLNALGKSSAPEWIDCFVEALCEYVVNGMAPKAYVSDENANWLMMKVDADGRVETLGELELIVRVLEKATNAPESLKSYAVTQIEKIVLTGEGATRSGGALRPAMVDAAEVQLLRRLLFAQASDGPASISKAEAEALFRIKDATLLHNNAPDWPKFFVQAVGNYLMAHNSYKPISRERAAELERFMDDHSTNLGRFMGRIIGAVTSGGFRDKIRPHEAAKDHDAAVAADNAITTDEAAWLKQKTDADQRLDPLEEALLKFIAEESSAD